MRFMALILLLSLASPAHAFSSLGFEEAAAEYGVSAHVLEAISWVESQQNPNIEPVRNERISRSGKRHVSYDHGHMQINDHYWKPQIDLIDPRLWEAMLNDPRICTEIGAWVLSQCVKRYGNTWNAIAAYNTGRSINLSDCLKATPSYKKGGPISSEDYADAQARIERGRAYALKVYKYLVRHEYISPDKKALRLLYASQKTKGTALPMRREPINIANYRKAGTWRLVE